MMDFVRLMELLKTQIDFETFERLTNDFLDEYANEYKKIKYSRKTAEKAQKEYAMNATLKESRNVFTDGHTILFSNLRIDGVATEKNDNFANACLDFLQNGKPVDNYIIDDVVLYETLRKQENRERYMVIDGTLYNPAFVKKGVSCVVTNKTAYVRVEKTKDNALLIFGDAGVFLVLPIAYGGKPHITKTINQQSILKYFQGIKETLLNKAIKTA